MIEYLEIPLWVDGCRNQFVVSHQRNRFIVRCTDKSECAGCPAKIVLPFDPRRIIEFTRVCNVYDSPGDSSQMSEVFIQEKLQKYQDDSCLWYWFTGYSSDMHTLFVYRLKEERLSPYQRICAIADKLAKSEDFAAFGEDCVTLIASYHQERYHEDTLAFLQRIESGAQCFEDIIREHPSGNVVLDITAKTPADLHEAQLMGLWHNLKTAIGQKDLAQFVEDLAIFEVMRKQAE